MPTKTQEQPHSVSSRELLRRAEAGESRALDALFARQEHALRRWARGRLPQWARRVLDTNDVVQDALLQTFRRIGSFDNRGRGALQAYLRQAVQNRINDELRRVKRQPIHEEMEDVLPDSGPSPFNLTEDAERQIRYKRALAELIPAEQTLIVGRLEMGYTYDQLALVSDRATPDAARVAVRRAIVKLANAMARG